MFEPADEYTIDLADCGRVSTVHSGPALISGNTIMGGGQVQQRTLGLQYLRRMAHRRGHRGQHDLSLLEQHHRRAIGDINSNDPGPIIRDNVFDLTDDNGITSSAPYFYICAAATSSSRETR